MLILGISAFYHDSAAALIRDGEIIAAAQEERFTRVKHDPSFPANAVRYCLDQANIEGKDIDHVVYYEKPFIKFERLLETYLAFAPLGFSSFRKSMPLWMSEKIFQRNIISSELELIDPGLGQKKKMLFSEHHFSHAASAFYASPFERAAVLTMDGVGEWATTSIALGNQSDLSIIKEIHFPHSLGLLYSAITYYTGFKVNSGEYKVMGLAPYGNPKYKDLIYDNLVDVKQDGSFHLNMEYFGYCTDFTMTNRNFDALFGSPPRKANEPIRQRDMDLAASIQCVTEDIILRITRSLAKDTGEKNLCLAGGVALNCVANGKILRDGYFESIFIQPAAGDAGGALGAALGAYYHQKNQPRIISTNKDFMKGSYLGPQFEQDDVECRLASVGAKFHVVDDECLLSETVDALVAGEAVGWHQGRMEFGPRALGARSILGDPRSSRMQKDLNIKVKFRESFRPFAPSVLRERVSDWFEIDCDSPYMLLVANVNSVRCQAMTESEASLFGIDKLNIKRSEIPAVTHVDYSARIQTVHEETNPRYYKLLREFEAKTGCPVLINTSFNVRGEPIVCTPEDAFRCFMGSDIEFLAVGNCILRKSEQNPDLIIDYRNAFELD